MTVFFFLPRPTSFQPLLYVVIFLQLASCPCTCHSLGFWFNYVLFYFVVLFPCVLFCASLPPIFPFLLSCHLYSICKLIPKSLCFSLTHGQLVGSVTKFRSCVSCVPASVPSVPVWAPCFPLIAPCVLI